MMYYDYNWFSPFHLVGSIITLLFWILIIVIIIRLIRGGRRNRHFGPDRSMEILKERYARGEITKEQFEQMKRDLQ